MRSRVFCVQILYIDKVGGGLLGYGSNGTTTEQNRHAERDRAHTFLLFCSEMYSHKPICTICVGEDAVRVMTAETATQQYKVRYLSDKRHVIISASVGARTRVSLSSSLRLVHFVSDAICSVFYSLCYRITNFAHSLTHSAITN